MTMLESIILSGTHCLVKLNNKKLINVIIVKIIDGGSGSAGGGSSIM